MDDSRFYILFNSISIIPGRWAGENKRPYAIEPRFLCKRYPPKAGLEPEIARSAVGKRLTY